ncbi:DHA2 family efflux MFS transporter permease subunit [Thermomicrobiaceae bacterium CFH 74404]|uniref:DHA2 family efflux MFS transporter permease subunit n=1 Tax=Thermalbibacter longus TaxID=2951981 RepID=A0AA42BC39_9BACT|nr:DHA2 family efflux MFS transporter permease subunit [Thermalbibacter longus]MCM8748383.1 DHA2 family efflux MFS transporter permease subunit [Thermalbibacter longus]
MTGALDQASAGGTGPLGAGRRPGARSILIFLVVCLALLMSSIGITTVTVAFPAMTEGLNASVVWVGWVLTGYQLAQTVMMPLAGKLSDELGRKRLFLACVGLFTASSFLCGIAPNVYLLILFRILQAVGGGAFMPSASGIISDVFDDRWRPTAIGLFASVFPVGALVGSVLGGWMVEHLGWRSVFINVPIGIVLLLGGLGLIPASTRPSRPRPIDLVGATLFALGMLGIMFGLTVLGNLGAFTSQVALWLLLGTLALVAFVYQEHRVADPMIDLRLLRGRAFAAVNLYNFLHGALVFGFFSFVPLYAIEAYHLRETTVGFILMPRALAMALCSALSSFFLIRLGYRSPMIAGIVLVSASLFLTAESWHQVSVAGHPVSDELLLAALVAISGIGVGISAPASSNAALELMPAAVARIVGMRGMFRSTGGVLGTALIVLLLTRFSNPGEGLAVIFRASALLILLMIPLVFLIPDTARLRRQARKHPARSARGSAAD